MDDDLEKLMAELNAEVKASKKQAKQLKKRTEEVQGVMNIKKEKPKNVTKDVILKKQPKYTFSKTQRFKEKKKEDSDSQSDLNSSQLSNFSATSATDFVKKKATSTLIGKTKRFSDKKVVDERDYDSNVDVVKKKATGIKINPEKQNFSVKKKSEKLKFLENFSEVSSQMMDDLETQASVCEPGPGAYEINYSYVDQEKRQYSSLFRSQTKRFKEIRKEDDLELNPNYKYLQKNAPTAVIKKTLPKTEKFKKKQEEKETQEQEAAQQYLQRDGDIDRGVRKNIGTAILKEIDQAPAGSRDKKFMLFFLLDKIRSLRANGPGTNQVEEEKPAPCLVKFRSSSTERRVPDLHQNPGPNYYYSRDDLCVENQPVFTFAKAGEDDHLKEPEEDRRRALDIKEDLIKPRLLGGYIETIPEERPINLQDIVDDKRGPGFYENNFKLIEKRTDVGAVKYQELTEQNDRENNMDFLKKETYDNDNLDPNLEAIKPQIKGQVKLHEPTDIQPEHIPDKELFKEKWKFYDGDLDQVREKLVKPVQFAGKKDREEFLDHENFMNLMREYFDRQRKLPEGYEVNYKQIDKKVQIPDLKKNLMKDLMDPIEKPEGQADGDNLLLNPDKPSKKLMNLNMKKQSGRPQEDIEEIRQKNSEQPELILNPKKEKKIKGHIDFKKQTKRPTYEEEIGDKREADSKPHLEPDTSYLKPKVKGAVNLKGMSKRPEGPDKVEQEINMDIKTDAVKPKVKGGAKW